jgi:hypothetical protein
MDIRNQGPRQSLPVRDMGLDHRRGSNRASHHTGADVTLFRRGEFTSAAGLPLAWKIECDALTSADWECIAYVGARELPPFWRVLAVPRGGIPLATALQRHVTRGARYTLICDDVWTTGKSIRAAGEKLPAWTWHGFVAFARGPLDRNVTAFATIGCARAPAPPETR